MPNYKNSSFAPHDAQYLSQSTTLLLNPSSLSSTMTLTFASASLAFSVLAQLVSGDTGLTTRYWDCCKPSCAWPEKAKVSEPIRTCNKQDLWPNPLDSNAASSCGNGEAYACSNNGPWAVNNDLAYGFAAAKLKGKSEQDWCCACYE
jgi:hypothetical protein